MRIDSFNTSYPLNRNPRPGGDVTPIREVSRDQEERRDQPAPPSASQGFEQTPQQRRVQAAYASSDSLPARLQDVSGGPRQLSNHAAQALASYSNTASFAQDQGAAEVLGLDIYA